MRRFRIISCAAISLASGCFDPTEGSSVDTESGSTGAGEAGSSSTEATMATQPTGEEGTVSGSADESGTSGEAVCGNGIVEDGELCDDGVNDGSYGHCNPGCMVLGPYCGDGTVNGPEPCDDGRGRRQRLQRKLRRVRVYSLGEELRRSSWLQERCRRVSGGQLGGADTRQWNFWQPRRSGLHELPAPLLS